MKSDRFTQMMAIVSVVIAMMMVSSCGHDEPDVADNQSGSSDSWENSDSSEDWAPESPIGKIIQWNVLFSDGTSGGSNIRVEFINKTDIKTNFSDWTTYTYKKTSDKSAHLNFMAPQIIGATMRTFQYNFDLIFTSKSEFTVRGTLTVNYLSGPNIGKTFYSEFTGKGSFVSSLSDDSDSSDKNPGKVISIKITSVDNITTNSADITGVIDIEGNYDEKGIVVVGFNDSPGYSTEIYSFTLPKSVSDFKSKYRGNCTTVKETEFTIKKSGLNPKQVYVVQAYAIIGDKLVRSEHKTFSPKKS